MAAAAINIFPFPHDKHLIDNLINATNTKAISSFLQCSIIHYLTTQNVHEIFRSPRHPKRGVCQSEIAYVQRQMLRDPGSVPSSRNTCLGPSQQKFSSGDQNTLPDRRRGLSFFLKKSDLIIPMKCVWNKIKCQQFTSFIPDSTLLLLMCLVDDGYRDGIYIRPSSTSLWDVFFTIDLNIIIERIPPPPGLQDFFLSDASGDSQGLGDGPSRCLWNCFDAG